LEQEFLFFGSRGRLAFAGFSFVLVVARSISLVSGTT
jgi:hypothetical protein